MRAVVIQAFGAPDQLILEERPAPLPGVGQIRVRVHASGLNRADLLQRRGLYPPPPGYDPMRLGLEYAGVVERLGDGCTRLAVGMPVMGVVPGEAAADYVVVAEEEAIPVPQGVGVVAAAAIPEAFATAYDAIFRQGELQAGNWCLIRAATSGVGIAACQLVRALGGKAIGTSRARARGERLLAQGATAFVVEGEEALAMRVQELTGGQGVQVVLDLAGGPALPDALKCLCPQGRLLAVGFLAGATATVDMALIVSRRLRIQGTVLRSRAPAERVALAKAFTEILVPLFAAGRLQAVIDSVLPLAEVRAGHVRLESNQHFGKVLLRMVDEP